MKLTKLLSTLIVLIGFFSTSSHAALIKETWNFKVTSASGDYLTKFADDTFSLLFTYDDQGTRHGTYYDNGSEDFLCKDIDPVLAECSRVFDSNDWYVFTDTDFSGFDNLFDIDALSLAGGKVFDSIDYYKNFRASLFNSSTFYSRDLVNIENDVISFGIDDRSDLSEENGRLSFTYQDASGNEQSSSYQFIFTSRESEALKDESKDIPEPSTLVMFGIGILGIFNRKLAKR